MEIVGVICEYNPLHNGHARQLRLIRRTFPGETAVVCLMSGNYVQRGGPAIFHKSLRARAALAAGADLVLELPVNAVLSSAEGFARGGVEILGPICTRLCFGAEAGDPEALMENARLLLSEAFPPLLRRELETGISFPAARQRALEALGGRPGLLEQPNNILATEYCKAILEGNHPMAPMVLHRPGDYHAAEADPEAPSATALRRRICRGEDIGPYVPPQAREIFRGAEVHTLRAGERAVLARLRTMGEAEFEALPYGSEGLWRKLMHESRRQAGLEDILTAVKSKRYTRSRLDRMALCAFLGISRETLARRPDYCRILGFSPRGQRVIPLARKHIPLVNAGEPVQSPGWDLEQRCEDLYGLFAATAPGGPGSARRDRVVIRPEALFSE